MQLWLHPRLDLPEVVELTSVKIIELFLRWLKGQLLLPRLLGYPRTPSRLRAGWPSSSSS